MVALVLLLEGAQLIASLLDSLLLEFVLVIGTMVLAELAGVLVTAAVGYRKTPGGGASLGAGSVVDPLVAALVEPV